MVCCIGREITREDDFAGLDWMTPCPVPSEQELVVDGIPMPMCVPHFLPLHAALEEAGLLETVELPQDPSHELIERWGTPDLDQGQ